MKIITKLTIGILGFFAVGLLLFYGAWLLSPGSYAKAEIYKLNISENSLIEIINEVKNENPDLVLRQMVKIPNGGEFILEEGRSDSSDYWYNIYFYYADTNQIVKTWIRPLTETKVDFAFVAVNNGLTLGNWTDTNKYFWWWKNSEIKTEFENRILKKIEEKINEKKSHTN